MWGCSCIYTSASDQNTLISMTDVAMSSQLIQIPIDLPQTQLSLRSMCFDVAAATTAATTVAELQLQLQPQLQPQL